MKPWLILINDFSHDLFTGLWFGSFVTMFILHGRAVDATLDAGQLTLIGELEGTFFWLTFTSLGFIALTGILRSRYYRQWDGTAMKEVKKRLLIIKHAVLGSALLIGSGFVLAWGL
jgi:uncharacterized membrane protein